MKPSRRRGGFAMIMALMLMGMVALTIAAFGVAITSEARRTAMLADQAQLRQLLLAGTQAAEAQLPEMQPRKKIAVPLPEVLVKRGAAVELQFEPAESSGERIVHVDAVYDGHRYIQRLHFARKGQGWELIAADFGA
jgi:hypothetical protein